MIREASLKDKREYNKCIAHPLQTWEWGEFRKKAGNIPYRFAKFDKNTITSGFQLLGHRIPKTNYKIATLIKGPTPKKSDLIFLKDFAQKEKIIFIKFEPSSPVNTGSIKHTTLQKEQVINTLKSQGAVEGKTLFTPTTFWIDLLKSEEDLLNSFHSKTRYNIRLATKKGVTVKEDNSDNAFNTYLSLTKETVERQGFYAHTKKYHQVMWKVLHKDMVKNNLNPIARLLTARYKDEIITTWILFAWGNFLYYPYGASSSKHKNVMANNLMMWEAIKYGKTEGLEIFDLWGREPGKGFTKFKEGYNPEVIEFLGTWDMPTSSLYNPYLIADTLRWQILKTRTKIGLVKPTF